MVDITTPFIFQQSQYSSRPVPFKSSMQNLVASPQKMSKRGERRSGYASNVAQQRIQPGLTTGEQQFAHTTVDGDLSTGYSTAPPVVFGPAQASLGFNKWLQVPQDANTNSTTSEQRVDNYYSSFPAEQAWHLASNQVAGQAYPAQQSPVPRYTAQPPPSRRVTPTIQITPHSSSTYIRQQEAQLHSFDSSPFRPFQQDLLTPFLANMSYEQQQQISDIPPQQHVPVSPISHHSGPSRGVSPLGEPTRRKRSFSQLEQQPDHSPLDSNHSLHATSPSGLYNDDSRPVQRITRTLKRSDAPTNENHKYICMVSPDCAALTFDRKCEWSKHMDKHDRPYRCPHAQCAKLQGFTYSGGLLRHEREVHNKHGGPKAFLMCPHPNCKRHTDKGFTRRENLQEHLRRVHSGKEDPSEANIADMEPGTELDTPASALSAPENEDIYAALTLKRRRSNADEQRTAFEEVNVLRTQIQRLKAESDAKDGVIRQLEEEARMHAGRIYDLEQRLQPMQPSAT